jgi:hypothetical protein
LDKNSVSQVYPVITGSCIMGNPARLKKPTVSKTDKAIRYKIFSVFMIVPIWLNDSY